MPGEDFSEFPYPEQARRFFDGIWRHQKKKRLARTEFSIDGWMLAVIDLTNNITIENAKTLDDAITYMLGYIYSTGNIPPNIFFSLKQNIYWAFDREKKKISQTSQMMTGKPEEKKRIDCKVCGNTGRLLDGGFCKCDDGETAKDGLEYFEKHLGKPGVLWKGLPDDLEVFYERGMILKDEYHRLKQRLIKEVSNDR